ncbi:MAG TPA: 50S ribosomal protein L6, partial [Ignisphaera sp.]|nr:50S ribosomal protein L6 [Ignisphaera sp.]
MNSSDLVLELGLKYIPSLQCEDFHLLRAKRFDHIDGDTLTFDINENSKAAKAMWGTVRALANNAIIGLTKGFEKKLEINGVGYRASVKGNVLELQL